MMSQKWYMFLNKKDEDGNYNKKSLLKYENYNNTGIVVCKETTNRAFSNFSSFLSFYDYLNRTPENYKCFYEYIFGNYAQKIYADFDIKKLQDPSKMKYVPNTPLIESENITESACVSSDESWLAVVEYIDCVKRIFPQIEDEDILIFNSHRENKYSYHVVIDRWCLPNSEQNKICFSKIMEIYPDEYKHMIDHSMYKSIQAFRIYGCHKWGVTSSKVVDQGSLWRPLNSNCNLEIEIFLASLISNTSYCNFLPSFENPKKKQNFESISISENNLTRALNMCCNFENCQIDDLPYVVGEIRSGLVLMRRVKSSFCNVCNRIHETENPYLIFSKKGNVYLDCRRNEKGKKLKLGNLNRRSIIEDDSEEEEEKKEECKTDRTQELKKLEIRKEKKSLKKKFKFKIE